MEKENVVPDLFAAVDARRVYESTKQQMREQGITDAEMDTFIAVFAVNVVDARDRGERVAFPLDAFDSDADVYLNVIHGLRDKEYIELSDPSQHERSMRALIVADYLENPRDVLNALRQVGGA